MSKTSKKQNALYDPGQLTKTRKNLGSLEKEEAARMIKVLGGEIGIEKNTQVNENPIKRGVQKYQEESIQNLKNQSGSNMREQRTSLPDENSSLKSPVVPTPFLRKRSLPVLSPKEHQLFKTLMESSEYRIHPTPNILSQLLSFIRPNKERISNSFIQKELPVRIAHIDNFTLSMQRLIIASTKEYKKNIYSDNAPEFKALRFINEWDTIQVKNCLKKLQSEKSIVTVSDTIPLIKELFRPLIKLYFLGISEMANIIKTLYSQTVRLPEKENEKENQKNLYYANQASTEWIYIFEQIIKGLYPLLMRMTTNHFSQYKGFYTENISKILPFLEITKYDLIIQKNQKKPPAKVDSPPPQAPEDIIPAKTNIPQKSLETLDRMFPEAGWLDLQSTPDMYSYFQPLYQFPEGFNLISPKNPLQITIILLRILEDFFKACRNINFNIDDDPNYFSEKDSIQNIFTDWSQYREVLFDKVMNPKLRDYVNHVYTQNDFAKSKYAKKECSSWLWQMKYNFHPYLVFPIEALAPTKQDDMYKPLPRRIRQATDFFSNLARNAKTEEGALKANFNAIYSFDIENGVSYRLDILLGGKQSKSRTNLNLIKYTLSALHVLDWWINDKESLAYSEEIKIPYRVAPGTNTPVFSVLLRTNQKAIFLHHVRKTIATKKAAQEAAKTDTDTSKDVKKVPPTEKNLAKE